jgi:Uncharacterized small protein
MGTAKDHDIKKEEFPLEVQTKIIDAIRSLKYGVVSIIVQDGHVIQIEKLEKERLK